MAEHASLRDCIIFHRNGKVKDNEHFS